jgi:hypothetical protein
MYVTNFVRYRNYDQDTIRILDTPSPHRIIRVPMLHDVSLLGQFGAKDIGLIYKSGGLPWSLPREKIVFIERDKDVSTWLKQTWEEAIQNPDLLVLPQVTPDAD